MADGTPAPDPRVLPDFVNPDLFDRPEARGWAVVLNSYGVVAIPNFVAPAALQQLEDVLPQFKDEWWTNAVRPVGDKGELRHLLDADPALPEAAAQARAACDAGQFSYHFKRTLGAHFATCRCHACRLRATLASAPVLAALARVTGNPEVRLQESFASLYQRGHFLSLHHDLNKGTYAFVVGLTKAWNPAHGGLTHFWDADQRQIFSTAVPGWGSLLLFRVDDERHRMDHFVTTVTGPGRRLAYTGWLQKLETKM